MIYPNHRVALDLGNTKVFVIGEIHGGAGEKYEDSDVSVLGLLRPRSDLKSIFFLP